MLRLLLTLVGIGILTMPGVVRAEFSPSTMNEIVGIVCSEEMSISAPEEHLWDERCNYRFEHEGAKIWVFHQVVRDFMEESCPRLRPWCVGPYRILMISVRWPHADAPSFEELIVDEGARGTPHFAVLQGTRHDELRFDLGDEATATRAGSRAHGLEHRARWEQRYGEMLRIISAHAGAVVAH